jgi:hypothetical protein
LSGAFHLLQTESDESEDHCDNTNRINSGNFCFHFVLKFSSVAGIATGYGLDDRELGVRVPVESNIFTSSRHPDRLWGSTQPRIQLVQGALPPWIKRPGREADRSPPTIAEVKRILIYTSVKVTKMCKGITLYFVKFEIRKALTTKITVFWDVTPSSLIIFYPKSGVSTFL